MHPGHADHAACGAGQHHCEHCGFVGHWDAVGGWNGPRGVCPGCIERAQGDVRELTERLGSYGTQPAREIHVGTAAWNWMRRQATGAPPGTPGLGSYMGIPVYVEPGWAQDAWEIWEDGEMIKQGYVDRDQGMVELRGYRPGIARVATDG